MSCSVYSQGLTGGQESAPLVSVGSNPLLSESQFFWEFVFFRSFVKFTKFTSLGFQDLSLGTNCESFIRWRENSIVYCLFYIFIITISSSSISISIYFVVCLNCLYLNPRVLPFVHFSYPSRCGRKGEGWASGCLVLSCGLPGYITFFTYAKFLQFLTWKNCIIPPSIYIMQSFSVYICSPSLVACHLARFCMNSLTCKIGFSSID